VRHLTGGAQVRLGQIEQVPVVVGVADGLGFLSEFGCAAEKSLNLRFYWWAHQGSNLGPAD